MSNQNSVDDKSTTLEEKTIINSWEELDVKQDLLRGIYANGFENPSPIQRKAIIPILKKHDVIAQAQSGTGKTGCFTIATLELIDTDDISVQALILSPTRELSYQIKTVLDRIGINMKGLNISWVSWSYSRYDA